MKVKNLVVTLKLDTSECEKALLRLEAVACFIQFEIAMRKLQRLMEATPEEVERWEEAMKAVCPERKE